MDNKNITLSKENDVIENSGENKEDLIRNHEKDESIEENTQKRIDENTSKEEMEESDNMISFSNDENEDFDEKDINYNLKDLYDAIEVLNIDDGNLINKSKKRKNSYDEEEIKSLNKKTKKSCSNRKKNIQKINKLFSVLN